MNNENLKPVQELTPFTKMIMTIGTLPSSFYASMSYYESMVWLYEYLKNQVIPTVNNNAEAVEELQTAFVELKEWTETYTKETIPIEVEKKLDEMATDGTLENIMKYLGVLSYDTVNDMKLANNFVNGSVAETCGFHTINDGGSAKYKIRNKTDEDVIDEMFIVSLANENLIAELLYNDINVKQLGAYGDNNHDDTSIIKAVLNKSNVNILFPEGIYLINEELNLSFDNVKIYSNKQATIFYSVGGRKESSATGEYLIKLTGDNISINNITFNTNNEYIRRPHQPGTTDYNTWSTYRTNSIGCFLMYNGTNIQFNECKFIGGIFKSRYVTNFTYNKCVVTDVPADCYYIEDGCHDGFITNCEGYNNGDDCFSININDFDEAPYNIILDKCFAQAIEGAMFCCYGSHDVIITNSIGKDIRRCGGFRAAGDSTHSITPYNITVDNCMFDYSNSISGNDRADLERGVSTPIIEGINKTFNTNIKISNSLFNRNSGELYFYLYFINVKGVFIENCTFNNLNISTLDTNTSTITFKNCLLNINREIFIQNCEYFKILNCTINNDCSQNVPDVESDTRACIVNLASYNNTYLNNNYNVTTESPYKYIKIASNFSPTTTTLFTSDSDIIKNYHSNYAYVIKFNINPIVVTTTVTPSSTSRTYETIDISPYVNFKPKGINVMGIAPSTNADASLGNMMIQTFDGSSCIVRYTPNVAELTYTIQLTIIM